MLLLDPEFWNSGVQTAELWEMVCKDRQSIGPLGAEFDERGLPLGKNQR